MINYAALAEEMIKQHMVGAGCELCDPSICDYKSNPWVWDIDFPEGHTSCMMGTYGNDGQDVCPVTVRSRKRFIDEVAQGMRLGSVLSILCGEWCRNRQRTPDGVYTCYEDYWCDHVSAVINHFKELRDEDQTRD